MGLIVCITSYKILRRCKTKREQCGNPTLYTLQLMHCSLASHNKGVSVDKITILLPSLLDKNETLRMLSDAPLHLLSSAKHVAHGRGRQRRTALATGCEALAILRAFFLGAFRVAHHALHNVGAAPGAVAHVRAVKHLYEGCTGRVDNCECMQLQRSTGAREQQEKVWGAQRHG